MLNKQKYIEQYQEIEPLTPVISLEENYGTSLVNYIFIRDKGFEVSRDGFLLSCLKYYIQASFDGENHLNHLNDFLLECHIEESTDLDFKQKISNITMQRVELFIEQLKSIEIDFQNGESYTSFLDTTYEHFGVFETKKHFYAFFRILG